jgi:hypothetical protein
MHVRHEGHQACGLRHRELPLHLEIRVAGRNVDGASDGADNTVSFTINRSGGLDGTVVLRYDIRGSGTLTADRFVFLDADGVPALPSGQVTFGPDETVKTITLRLANNALVNANELITLF